MLKLLRPKLKGKDVRFQKETTKRDDKTPLYLLLDSGFSPQILATASLLTHRVTTFKA